MADSFDYVIIGSGAAGSVLAARLTEDPAVTVCVLEAGPPDRNPWIHIPAGFIKTMVDPSVTWQFRTEPTEMTGGRRIPTIQGRTLGGGSAVHRRVAKRVQNAQLDNWAHLRRRG
ncbi:MAG: GMC family oxidoreductase N-terminal domain-containing protein, partial [Roseomonas sp.]|nr:GMC family oxidoreductase N-terminal domain-containing protein [Roseomonas sp.]